MVIALIAVLYLVNVIFAYFIYTQQEELIKIEKLLFKYLSELERGKDEKNSSDN